MNPGLLREMLIAEALRRGILGRGGAEVAEQIESETFPQQRAFIEDESKRITLKTPRRAAKTESIIRKMYRKMKRVPGSISVYVSMTRENAKRNIWTRLQVMAARYGLEVVPHHTDLTIRDPLTNSMIWVTGLATAKELAKLRGNKYDLVVIDEIQDILIDIEDFIMSVIVPALGDRRGQLVCAGTPDPWRRNRYWHDMRNSKDPKWRRWIHHTWLLTDNTFFLDPAGYLKQVLEEEGYTEDDPRYRAEYLGEDAISTSNLVIDSFNYDRNCLDGSEWDLFERLPGYHYLLSIHPRFKRSTAFVVACYSSSKRHAVFAESFFIPGMDPEAAFTAAELLLQKYPLTAIVVNEEGLGKKVADELNQRYSLPILPAETRDEKMQFAFMNSDLRTGRLQVVPLMNEKLIEQWGNVLWDADRERIAEGQECDLYGAMGYAHMACRSFFDAQKPQRDDDGEEYWKRQIELANRGNDDG